MPTRLATVTLDAAELVAAHPPRISNANKRVVYDIACPPERPHRGSLTVSRWRADTLPTRVSAQSVTALEARADLFAYGAEAPDTLAWHVNFADLRLFVAYGSGLLAQDEMQVAEHPALASLCEYLTGQGSDSVLAPFTRDQGRPTPYLVRGVERRCVIATNPDVDEDRPYGLYGNRFARSRPDVVRRATRAIVPPTVSHIVAMHAPPGGSGVYSMEEILDVAITAYTAMVAARTESKEAGASRTVVHTGHWGTGAYGGNRVLMALLQMIAARLAEIDALVFHAVDDAGMEPWREARALLEREIWPLGVADGLDAALHAVQGRAFRWGVSDGN